MVNARSGLLLAWMLIGGLLGYAYGHPLIPLWVAAVWIPWLLGVVLVVRIDRARLEDASTALFGGTASAPVLALAGTLTLICVHVFSLAAALFLLTWAGFVGLLLISLGRSQDLRNLFFGATTAATSLFLIGWALNFVLALPAFGERWGSPDVVESWEQRYDGLWNRNVFGLRSPYEKTDKPEGTIRIVALGDSFTWGDKVESSDSVWPAQLEALLRERYPERTIEVINTGRRGFTTANEAEMLERVGWQFDPDLVVLQWLVNDPWPSGPNFQRLTSGDVFPSLQLLPSRFRTGTIGRSALYAFVNGGLSGLVYPLPTATRYDRFFDADYSGFLGMEEALASMANEARAHGVPILIMVWPEFIPGEWTEETFPRRPLLAKVKEIAAADGYHVLDLTATFAAEGGDWSRWWAEPWDGHPGIAAHALSARVAAELIENAPWCSDLWASPVQDPTVGAR